MDEWYLILKEVVMLKSSTLLKKRTRYFRAIKKGAILENVVLDKETKQLILKMFQSLKTLALVTQFTYRQHPRRIYWKTQNIFFLPLTLWNLASNFKIVGQAAYHFISGYTAK
jgi:phosphoenolpyruvate carboxykinase (ATP)